MTSISKNVCIDKLDDIVNKYNNRYHSTIKIKPIDVKSRRYIYSSKEINDKDAKLKIVLLESFTKNSCQKKKHQKKLLIEKVVKGKGDKV